MAYNIRTVVKIFMIFLFFQLSLAGIVQIAPILNTNPSQDDTNYINFINQNTNFISSNTSSSLITNLENGMPKENTWNDNILTSFLGVFKIIAASISFLIQIAINVLFCPTIMSNILLYSAMGGSWGVLLTFGILINIGFYSLMFFIVFRESFK